MPELLSKELLNPLAFRIAVRQLALKQLQHQPYGALFEGAWWLSSGASQKEPSILWGWDPDWIITLPGHASTPSLELRQLDIQPNIQVGSEPRQSQVAQAKAVETKTFETPEAMFAWLEVFIKDVFIKDPIKPLQAILPKDFPVQGLPWACLASYGFSRWCDPALSDSFNRQMPQDIPDLMLCRFRQWGVAAYSQAHAEPQIWHLTPETAGCKTISDFTEILSLRDEVPERIVCTEMPGLRDEVSEAQTISVCQESSRLRDEVPEVPLNPLALGFNTTLSPEAFSRAVGQILAQIRQGELYQANLSVPFFRRFKHLVPEQLYEAMQAENPSPFAGLFRWPGGQVLSNSPERLVAVNTIDSGRQAQTRPIAGTRGRGQNAAEDAALGQSLRQNIKEQAEHMMLVDLARNDLGRCCQPGSVRVTESLSLERYAHVTHLVSNVVGQLRPEASCWDVFRAMFPGGTITGCPKIRCIQSLENIEPMQRGIYTGSLGLLDPETGTMDWNILIRSLFLRPVLENEAPKKIGSKIGSKIGGKIGGKVEVKGGVYDTIFQVGAGIVADSVPEYEYRECLRKAQTILRTLAPLI